MAPVVLGRQAELEQLTAMLDAVVAGPRAVVVEGPAGIGKTTMWQAALEAARARSFTVLAARAAQTEATLPFAGLIDLLEGVSEAGLSELPAPQRRALEVALLRREPEQTGVDQLAVSLATLQVLRTLATDAPVVVGIDDLQWLDGATTRVLAFVLRRLGDERLGLVVSVRAEHADRLPLEVEQALPEPQRLVLRVGPLPVSVLDQLLRERLGLALSRPSLQRLQQVCAGNSFYALELARVLPAGATLAPGEALQVPTTLAGLLRGRLQQVPDRARGLLLAAAALAKPTVALLQQVGGGLDEALAAGIMERDEVEVLVRFRHPLFGSLVYADATAPQRHQTHRLLAELVDEPEEQALHLALGTQDPDERAAGRLEDAAQRASARGAPDAAAQLAEHASRLTPTRWSPADCRRRLAASNYHARAGNGPRARNLLEALIAHVAPGTTRAKALVALADLVTDNRWDELFTQARAEAADDLALRAQIERRHGRSKGVAGDYAAWEQHAQAAVVLAEAADDIAQLVQALAELGTVRMFRGHGVQHELMARALALESSAGEVAIEQSPTLELGMQLLYSDEFDQARHLLQAEAARALEHGSIDVRSEALLLLTELEIRAGSWPLADQYASECLELARQLDTSNGEPMALYGRALVDAHLGRVEAARGAAEQGSALAAPMGDETFRMLNEHVLGFLELSVGDPARAHARLGPLVQALHARGQPTLLQVLPDEIEALISLGELDQAEPLIEELDAQGRALDRAWALATAARCRGLLAAARGDPSDALAHFQRALQEHERVAWPFELARTLRAQGMVLRRDKHKTAAKSALEQALGIFERLGAPLWAQATNAELDRVGLRPAAPVGVSGITAAEARVAELVAAGRTNREVAGELFMSPKTVEAHLSRIYRKLGVRSRAELAHKLTRQSG